MAPKPLYNWLDWWNTRRSSWGSIRGKARAQTSWGNARGRAPAASKIAGANGTSVDTAALVVNASGSNASPEQYISPQQYVVINDANPLLTAAAQSLWEQALASASGYLGNLLSNPDRDQLLQEVFGKAGTDSATFAANLQALLNSLSSTGLRIEVDLRSDAELNGALAAYAAVGHTGSERIYVNGDKLNNGQLDLTLTTSALLEEFGHAIDRRLNGGFDSRGDEGQLFAAEVTGFVLTADQRAVIDAEDDSAVLAIEGAQVAVEQATTAPTSSTLGTNYTSAQTISPSTASSVSITATVNNTNNNGADILVAAYQGTTLIGWSAYDRTTQLRNNSTTLTFDLAQFDKSLTAGSNTTGLIIRTWQGTYNGSSGTNATTATASGTSTSVAFTPNATSYSSNTTVSGTLTSGSASRGWAVNASDLTRPTLAITTPISTNGFVNNAEDESSLTISGTSSGADGRTVTVAIGGNNYTGTIATGGAWSVSLTSTQVKALTVGTVNITANVSDTAGNPATQATASFTYDITAPTLAITTPISTDGFVNNAEDESSLIISGTSSGADGRTVTVAVGSITGQTATIATGGAWSITLTSAQVKTLTEGTVNITANVSDTAGNPATQATASFTYDITAPTLAITSSASALRSGQTATITFTFSEDPGSTFTWNGTTGDVVVTGGTLGAISGSGLTRTATFTPTASLASGSASITVAASSYTDAAGNNGGAGTTPSISIDTLAPTATVAITAVVSDTGSSSSDYITSDTTLEVNGSNGSLGSGEKVQISTDGSTWADVSVATATTWTYTDPTTRSSSLTYQVRVIDTAGNVGNSASQLVTIDTGAPTSSVGSQSVQLVEAGGIANGTAGTAAATITVTKTDALTTASFDTTYLTSNGWSTADSGVTYTKAGTYGTATFTIASGVVAYALNNSATATQALTANQPASDGFGSIRIIDTAGNTSLSSEIAFAITGTNDAPVGVNDSGSATEAGGTSNGTAGSNATGNVLNNDEDVDSAETVTAVRLGATEGAGTAGTIGTGLAGTYGTLTLASNGSYTYVVNESNATVQALNSGGPLTDSFNYTFSDGSLSDIAVLNVTIDGANDASILDLNTSDASTPQTTTLTFNGAGYDVGDVVSVVVDGVTYSHTVLANATSAENVYDALKAVLVNSVTLANSLASKGDTWAENLTSNAVTLTSTAGAANAFTLTSAVNNNNDLGVGTYRIDWENDLNGFFGLGAFSGNISINIFGTTYTSANATGSSGNTRFDNVAPGLAGQLTAAGYPTTYSSSANSFDITILSSSAVTTLSSSTSGGAYGGGTFSTVTPFVAPTDQASPSVSTTTTAATASNNFQGTFTENGSPILLATGGNNLSDVDNTAFNNIKVAYTTANFADGSSEQLLINGATSGGTISGLGTLANGATGTLTLGGVIYAYSLVVAAPTSTITFTGASGATLSTAQAEALVDAFQYNNTSHNPTAGSNRVFSVTPTDAGGLAGNTATFTATVVAVNDAPSITSSATASFAENGTGTVYTATASDPDNTTFTYSIAGTDASLFNINSTSGAVTFKSAPNFEAPADAGANNVYDITVTASDGILSSAAQAVAVTVTDLNEFNVTAPTDSNAAANTVAENSANGTTVGLTANASDADGTTNTVTYSLVSDATGNTIYSGSEFAISSTSGVVTVAGAINYEAGATRTLYVKATSADNSAAVSTFTVNVTDIDEFNVTAPTDSNAAANTVAENSANGTTVGLTANASDNDGTINAVTYSLVSDATGNTNYSGSEFAINSTSGVVTVAGAINYEAGTTRTLYVKATSADNSTAVSTFTINVTDVDEFNVTVPTDNNASANTVAENSANGTTVGLTANASDADGTTNAVTYSLVSDATGNTNYSGSEFAINSTSGVVTVAGAINYEAGTTRTLYVKATSADNSTAVSTFTVNVTNVNEAPSVTSGATASFAENGTGTVYTATATDPDASATLTYSIAGTDAALFNINSTSGAVTFKNAPNFEAPADAGANDVYDITVTASDGTLSSAAQSVAISVTNVNEAPSITSGATASFAENGTGTVYTATATDPDASSALTYSIAGTDAALFNINSSNGAVTFKNAPNFEAPADAGGNNVYDITVTASDGSLSSAARAVAISVTNINEAPSITSGATASFAENGTGTVYTATASDPDASATLTYSIAGTDAALFNINSTSGAVTFKNAPNFEAPADAGGNNVYDITVTASDGSLSSAARAVAITVTNVNEAPSIISGATASFAENGTGTVYTATASDPDASASLTYSIAGADANLFNINSSTGAVTFKNSPNFEAPQDAGANNVYDFTVTASDGTLSSAAQAVAITVTDVDDTPPNAPLITSVSDDVNPVTGVVANGGSTNDTVLLIAGTAEANSTIQLFNGATSIGSTTADGAGAWTFTTGTLASDTQYSFNATATDAAGNVSAASANYTISVDTGPPAAVTLTLGSGLSDGATAAEATAATGAVSVVAQAGTNVAVSFSRSQGGSVTKNLIGSGAAQAVVLSTADLATLGDGVINVSAVASDAAGNTSDPATATFTLDTSAPQPLALTLQADTGSSSRDGITSNPQVLVSQLDNGTVWEVSTNAGSSWTTGSGNSFGLVEGSYASNQVQVRQRDTAGNISTATGNSTAWLVDTTAPQFIAGSSATATSIFENSGSNRVVYTPQMAATEAATGGVLRYSLLNGGDASSFSVATFSGAVTLLGNPDYESKSSYAFTLRARDVAGNATNQTVSLQVLDLDEVAPDAPQIAVVASDDTINGTESTGALVISGTAEAGSLVTVRWANNPARTATATDGSWSVSYSASEIPANGSSVISATAEDLAGNLSSTGSRSVLVDRIAPGQPLLNTVAGDNIINASERDSGISLQGSAEAGSTVRANLAGIVRTVQADASGNWQLSYGAAELPGDGLASLRVPCTDLSGNVSAAATRLLQVDTAAPLVPSLQNVTGDNSINAAEAAAGIQLNGSAEAGSTVQALWGGIDVGSAVASSAGIWTINVAAADLPANGSSTLQITSRDAAGNSSGSLSRAIELDRLAPSIPAINNVGNGDVVNAQAAESGVLVSGTAEAGSLVRVKWGDQIRSVIAGSDGTWQIDYSSSQLPLNGQSTITATAMDALGNVSGAASRPVLIDTTPSSILVTNLKLSADSGSSDTDFVTAQAVQLLSGSLSAELQTGETVQVSLDGGSQWISAQAGSPPLSFSAPVNLGSGDTSGTIQVVVVDAAGNSGAVRSQAYRLESGPNSNGIASLSIASDSGVVGDLLTNVSLQSLRGTLLSPLQAGERIQFRSLQSNGSWSGWGTASGSTNSSSFTFHGTFQEGGNQLELRHLDIAGNASQTFSLAPQLDSAAPKVSSITLNGAGLDRAWQAGDLATIQVNFSESIRVSGIPALTLSLANQSRPCKFEVSSGNQLQFTYTISANDLANGSPVIAIVPGSLDLSDVAISDAAGNIALAAINNQLIGSGSADLINGTSLNDVITGAAGSDQLSGGLGSDLFVFRSGGDSCLGSNGTSYDTITDFQLGSDQLQLGIFAPVSSFEDLGSTTDPSASSLGILLNSTNFQAAGFGAQFSVGSATFLAVNDANPGFSAVDDLVVMASNSF